MTLTCGRKPLLHRPSREVKNLHYSEGMAGILISGVHNHMVTIKSSEGLGRDDKHRLVEMEAWQDSVSERQVTLGSPWEVLSSRLSEGADIWSLPLWRFSKAALPMVIGQESLQPLFRKDRDDEQSSWGANSQPFINIQDQGPKLTWRFVTGIHLRSRELVTGFQVTTRERRDANYSHKEAPCARHLAKAC